jgi:2-phospho-L-lactate guanylyltransferase
MHDNVWAIIPVKTLDRSKQRLAPVLTLAERGTLVCTLLAQHLRVLATAPRIVATLVVSRDATVQQLARSLGATALAEPETSGLNGALREGLAFLRTRATHGLILPADLPFLTARDIEAMVQGLPLAAIGRDRHGTGTNGLLVSAETPFPFQFGLNSFHKHCASFDQAGLPFHSIDTPGVRFDLDTPEDWQLLRQADIELSEELIWGTGERSMVNG